MNIVVLVKQVPDTTEMNVDKETGTLIRTGVPTIINPDDLAGIEEALKLKDHYGAKVTALTMGPQQADGMLRELLARGVDEVILLTDRRFAGADTWATSNTLSKALEKIDYDLIIAGRQAIDGDTAQVGPQTAEKLGIPQVSYVNAIQAIDESKIIVKKALEDAEEVIEVSLPCLITTLQGMNTPRYMHCEKIWQSFDQPIIKWGFDDLEIDPSIIGLKGSPTKVKKTFIKEVSSMTNKVQVSNEEAVQLILNLLKEKQLVG
jgi:electron transfer flavoprotein beta subunit